MLPVTYGCAQVSKTGATAKTLPGHTLYSGHRATSPADSPRVYFATIELLDHWPCRMIAESGAPA